MIETFVLNMIYLFFPFSLYIICYMYNSTLNKKMNRLLFNFFIISAFYFLVRFGKSEISFLPLALISIPLLLAYIEKEFLTIILLNGLTFYYLYSINFSWIFVIIMLLLNLVLYFILYYRNVKKKSFIISYISVHVIHILIQIFINHISISILESLFYFTILVIFPIIFIIIFEKLKNVAGLHTVLKSIEKEEKFRLSLFKITHEIKNPIAVCKGYLDMIDTSNVEHCQKYIPIVHSEIERTLCLLKDFLDLNKVTVEMEELDFGLLMEEIKSSCLPLLQDKKISYKDNLTDEEVYINGDFNRLKQVFVNIVKNSVESLEGIDEPSIEINYICKNKKIFISISDNGCGMDKETLSKINEPFFTTKPTGTGLGVTISSEIIHAHKGNINYKSQKGKGTEVNIVLPLSM